MYNNKKKLLYFVLYNNKQIMNSCIIKVNHPVNHAPEYVHRNFLSEAECILFERPSVTMICKSYIVFYRLCFKNPLAGAL